MKRRNRLIMLLIVSIIAKSGLFAQQAIFKALSFEEEIEELMLERNVPAIGMGIIEDGTLKQIMVLGELKNNAPAPYNTIFQVASLTKPVTTMLTLSLVSMGEWNLDEPVCKYWVDPDIADDPRHLILTTRHILTHQTGFDNWRNQSQSKKLVFNFDPGTGSKYSGEGFEYLRRSLEHKFQMSLQQLADSILFKPLGMKDTRYTWDDSIDESRYAFAHDKSGNFIEWTYEREKNKESCAADLLKTTVEDYCKFGISVIEGNGLTEEVFEDMIKPHVKGSNMSKGFGWGIYEDLSNGEYALIHTGHDDGIHSTVLLLPESKRGVVVFTNGENGSKMYEELISGSFDIGAELYNRMLTKNK